MNVILISFCGGLTIIFGINALFQWLTQKDRELKKRLEKVSDLTLKLNPENDDHFEKPNLKKGIMPRIGKPLFRKDMTKKIEEQLARADIPLRGEEFLLIWIAAGLIPGSLVFLLTHNVALVLVSYLLGILVPPFLVTRAQQNKIKKFNQQIGDSLSIMSNALRAGFSFLQAMEMVSREMPEPICKEFARTFREINLGTPTEDALHKMVKRISSDDLELLVTAVLIQRQVGGNLAEILDNISHTIRERIRIKGEIKTLTAQGRISGLIIGLIPPCLILLLLFINPGYMKPLLQTQIGWTMLGAGAFTEVIGIILIKKIITIDF